MYLKTGKHPEAKDYQPYDLENDEWIPHCIEANDDTGEYWVYDRDEKGNFRIENDELAKVKRQGNIRLIKR